jgi:pSer/pThr/pTyr-binding forkhead associated (FHA) protein
VILNGQRVSDSQVRDGSHIQLGTTDIIVRITESESVATSTTDEGEVGDDD